MRHAAALMIACALASPGVFAEGFGPSLTVLLDFREAASRESLGEMQREVQQLLEPSGLRVELKLKSDFHSGDSFSDLVLVRFNGNCAAPVDPMLIDERGPLAFARTSGGQVLPFGEVACDSVRRAVETALWGGQRNNREELFGRALGRVVAHELVHILVRTDVHGKSGVFKPSLSGDQLIADHLALSPGDTRRLRESLSH
jgi:hypothetical protein